MSANLVVPHRFLRVDGMRRGLAGGGDGSHDGSGSAKQRSQSHGSILSVDVDDEDGGAVGSIVGGIEENAWMEGSRWVAPPSVTDYKDFFKGEMVRKFSMQGGSYPVKVHASDKKQMIFRCSTVPWKSHETKVRGQMKAAGEEYVKFSLKDATTCPFVVGFRKKEEKSKRAAGWYLTQYHEDHHEDCAMDDRKRRISVNAIRNAGVNAVDNYVPVKGGQRGSVAQLFEQANRQEGSGENHVHVGKWAARMLVQQASQGGMYDHLTNVTKLFSMIRHGRANDPEGIYILHVSPLSYDIPGVRKYVTSPYLTSHYVTSKFLTSLISLNLPSSLHSYSRGDAREIDFVYIMPAAAVKFFEHAGSCVVGSLDAAHRRTKEGGINFNFTYKTGSGENLPLIFGWAKTETMRMWEIVYGLFVKGKSWASVLRTDQHVGLVNMAALARQDALFARQKRLSKEAAVEAGRVGGPAGGAEGAGASGGSGEEEVPERDEEGRLTLKAALKEAGGELCKSCKSYPPDGKWIACGRGCLQWYCESKADCLSAQIRHSAMCRPVGKPFPGHRPNPQGTHNPAPLLAICGLHLLRNLKLENTEGKRLISNIANSTSERLLDFHLGDFENTFDKAKRDHVDKKKGDLAFIRLTDFLGEEETTYGEYTNNPSEQTNSADSLARGKDIVTALFHAGCFMQVADSRQVYIACILQPPRKKTVTCK